MGYIKEPKTVKDFEKNVKFQLDNVVGYINMGDFESAYVKAECMMKDFDELKKMKFK